MNLFFCCALIVIGMLFGAVEYSEISIEHIPKLLGVLGVLVTLFVFFGTQYLVDLRDKQKVMREKIESLYISIEDYRIAAYNFINLSFEADIEDILTIKNHHQDVINALNKIEMYKDLYFPTLCFDRVIHDKYRNRAFIRSINRLQNRKDYIILGNEHSVVFEGISEEIKIMKNAVFELIKVSEKPVRLGCN